MLWCPLRFPQKNDVRFDFTPSCLLEGSCLIFRICVCLHIVLSNTSYIWRMSYNRKEPFASSLPVFLGGAVLFIFRVLCVVLLFVVTFLVSCCDIRYNLFVFISLGEFKSGCLKKIVKSRRF